MKKLLVLLVTLMSLNAHADIIVMQFEGDDGYAHNTTRVFDGFNFYASGRSWEQNGSYLLPFDSTTAYFETVSGDTFDLISFDMSAFTSGAATLALVGHVEGGGTITANLQGHNTGFVTHTLNWTNLTRVNWTPSGHYSMIDNLTVNVNSTSATPEPSSYALMLLGLAGLGIYRRRQQAA